MVKLQRLICTDFWKVLRPVETRLGIGYLTVGCWEKKKIEIPNCYFQLKVLDLTCSVKSCTSLSKPSIICFVPYYMCVSLFFFFLIQLAINGKILVLQFIAFVLICKWIKLTGVRVKHGASRLPLVYKACCLADTALEPSALAPLSTTACPCISVLMPWASTKVYPYCFLQVSEKVWVLW